jgi:streptomycin 6-kinase
MPSNFIIPIPKNSPGHANYKKKHSVHDILSKLFDRQLPTHDDAGFPILTSSVKKNLKRLFKERKPFPYKKGPLPRNMYAIFNHLQQPAAVVRTKAEALRLLKKDSIVPTILGKKWKPKSDSGLSDTYNELLVGSTVIRIPQRGDSRYNIDTTKYNLTPSEKEFGSLHRVATKRCSSCPRANSATEERCGCSLLSYIKDQTPGWVYHTEHQLLMQRHRDRKKKDNVIKISIDDLIE